MSQGRGGKHRLRTGVALLLTLCVPLLSQGCGQSPQITIAQPNTSAPFLGAGGSNVLGIQIGSGPGSVCGQTGYENEPCTSLTLCAPGTSQCQILNDVLVDTGSVGLRVFQSVLSIPLSEMRDGSGNTLAECAQFGTGSDWGPLAIADVGLGGEPMVAIPVQLINRSFAPTPPGCLDADTDPQHAGYNGILGVGTFLQDCGTDCVVDPANQIYFSCGSVGPSGNCGGIPLPLSQQLQNPVAGLPTDNNGLVIAMPQAGFQGSASLAGVMILGIGTEANNSPTGVRAYTTDSQGDFTTTLSGHAYPGSFIDSGSNGIFFPNDIGLPPCSSNGLADQFYCPGSFQNLTAYNFSADGRYQARIDFGIANAESLLRSGNLAFPDLAGSATSFFDWGMPFFYGRAVFEGIEGQSSPIGVGEYVAY